MSTSLRSAVARLPERYGAVIELDLAETDLAESARRLGLNVATPMTRRMRARRRLAMLKH